MGKQVWTYRHHDHLNCPFGWSSTTALGHFDPCKAGHLVLWDLGLLVQFPPGSTQPSFNPALVRHSNLPVQPGET
ncbi:hypothetical protein GLOTRDRAFT_41842 [Gloeophyllum trabeum ATCC 11539]|uniref:Uncharacterized protein n=1 Tax=Gloeophyllum trabeum (strain ATCC 11539 / FP-39264 / Madison 617) TaxID=670483 RepID=S7Q7E8_GLOTA|nr:uncharacterized protein GLOTRDRAFT_41842 [Gloeophyllum trabeum ATCC 11539]EPQ55457.1 hypothetical protein GLOTRDRAFT_41842 [Gloeophyllum trabeum ATCC 11539]